MFTSHIFQFGKPYTKSSTSSPLRGRIIQRLYGTTILRTTWIVRLLTAGITMTNLFFTGNLQYQRSKHKYVQSLF